jgi:hypothetical protein
MSGGFLIADVLNNEVRKMSADWLEVHAARPEFAWPVASGNRSVKLKPAQLVDSRRQVRGRCHASQ